MEIPYVGCDSEQSAQHRCLFSLFSVSLSLHVCVAAPAQCRGGGRCCGGFGFLLVLPLLLSKDLKMCLDLSFFFPVDNRPNVQ